ncbi:uncharacterized protein PHALS_10332 [Plasmopara halstedii]|uniref:Uncharacterized protein n=1 Tax=Plasmopara halstedii TaxID=4781 RepID=A0A0N7L503_PLAHL|nr:uncharacterized protein PHALS_10332 [Plasmopara halstedii]CEG40115.1 hypothetical protein PHALS_10332 [Plasmopara halstedii]|eukprot:XP_024576484.1 hypothetical protein PHALS_10332 [Plasmopara halstedii]
MGRTLTVWPSRAHLILARTEGPRTQACKASAPASLARSDILIHNLSLTRPVEVVVTLALYDKRVGLFKFHW